VRGLDRPLFMRSLFSCIVRPSTTDGGCRYAKPHGCKTRREVLGESRSEAGSRYERRGKCIASSRAGTKLRCGTTAWRLEPGDPTYRSRSQAPTHGGNGATDPTYLSRQPAKILSAWLSAV
jgi:hypothetical protein